MNISSFAVHCLADSGLGAVAELIYAVSRCLDQISLAKGIEYRLMSAFAVIVCKAVFHLKTHPFEVYL